MVLILVACGQKEQAAQVAPAPAPAPAAPAIAEASAPIEAKASTEDISAAYSSDAKAAEKKFKGKKLEINGTIADIREDGISDLPEVILKLEQANKGVQPRVAFADSEAAKVAKLKKGQAITIICKGGEQFSGMAVLENCTLVTP